MYLYVLNYKLMVVMKNRSVNAWDNVHMYGVITTRYSATKWTIFIMSLIDASQTKHSIFRILTDGYIREIKASIIHLIIPNDINILCFNYYCGGFAMDSVILTKNEKINFYNLLKTKRLGNTIWRLLYRGSTNGFDCVLCHKKCQYNARILWIIHTDSNNVFGAYTSSEWNREKKDHKDAESFVFLIRSSNNYPTACFDLINKNSDTIRFNINYFCTIGECYDISIYKNCHKDTYCTFSKQGYYKMKRRYYLNGNERNFLVKEIEIFHCAQSL
eukprot:484719_1